MINLKEYIINYIYSGQHKYFKSKDIALDYINDILNIPISQGNYGLNSYRNGELIHQIRTLKQSISRLITDLRKENRINLEKHNNNKTWKII